MLMALTLSRDLQLVIHDNLGDARKYGILRPSIGNKSATMTDELPAYITVSDAAELLGVTRERIMFWIREGFLKPVGQTESGAFLLRRRAVIEDGEPLANLWPHRVKPKPRTSRKPAPLAPKLLLCGCCPARAPAGLCRIGVSLLAALQLAEGFAAEFSIDPLYRRIVDMTREALTKHLAGC
jgi:hypothetical protein